MKMENSSSKSRQQRVEDYYANKMENVELFVDNFADPHNVAAISRTADGLGVKTINTYYSYNEMPDFKRIGKKSSSTANKWIKFEKVKNLDKFVKEKKKEGFVFLGLDMKGNNIGEYKFPEKVILVLGSEKNGMSEEVRKVCDSFISIPMVGMVESYNVSVATAICMYEAYKQKGKKLKLKY